MVEYEKIQCENWDVELVNVYIADAESRKSFEHFLFLLLSDRDKFVNISHNNMPSFANHIKFVNSKPYRHWYIIRQTVKPYGKVGAIYLSREQEIGVFLLKQYHRRGYGTKALETFLRVFSDRPVYANINPENKKSIEFFTGNGFVYNHTLIEDEVIKQVTYARRV